ncbi:MAG: TRAP transporter permease [Ignavibacteriales bacterium]
MSGTSGTTEPRRVLLVVLASIFAMFQIYTAYFGVYDAIIQRAVHLGFVFMVGCVALGPSRRNQGVNTFNLTLSVIGAICCGYIVYEYPRLVESQGLVELPGVILGTITVALVFYLGIRSIGVVLPALAGFMILYAMFGRYVPGVLRHKGMSFPKLMHYQYLTTEGVFGIPLGVTATVVYMFILFGNMLLKSGAGKAIIDLATSVAGGSRGGPAKVSVVASGLFGSVSGSVVSNVVSTGTFTIPLMKSVGYSSAFAAAVEAVASTGGSIMPPVMGDVAFIMSDMLGVPYGKVALAAAIPALLYYLALFSQVHFRAVRLGLKGVPASERPRFGEVLRRRWHSFVPLVVLVYLLIVLRWSPMLSAFWAIIAVWACAAFSKEDRIGLRQLLEVFSDTAIVTVPSAIGCSLAGIIMGVLNATGVTMKFTVLVTQLAGNSTFLMLVLAAFASLVLGMGVTASIAYIVPAMIAAPVLIKAGIPPMAAHLFVYYYAIISYITPPVALGAYTAAGLADADPFKTGWIAMRLGLSALIVPFFYVFGPALILQGTLQEIVVALISASIGSVFLGVGLEGYLERKCSWIERILYVCGSLLLVKPGLETDLIGLAVIGGVTAYHIGSARGAFSRQRVAQ